jgi:hypothetical protein
MWFSALWLLHACNIDLGGFPHQYSQKRSFEIQQDRTHSGHDQLRTAEFPPPSRPNRLTNWGPPVTTAAQPHKAHPVQDKCPVLRAAAVPARESVVEQGPPPAPPQADEARVRDCNGLSLLRASHSHGHLVSVSVRYCDALFIYMFYYVWYVQVSELHLEVAQPFKRGCPTAAPPRGARYAKSQ